MIINPLLLLLVIVQGISGFTRDYFPEWVFKFAAHRDGVCAHRAGVVASRAELELGSREFLQTENREACEGNGGSMIGFRFSLDNSSCQLISVEI